MTHYNNLSHPSLFLLIFLSHVIITTLSLSMNSNNNNKRNLTAAQQARKAEEQRRKARQHDVIPGRTSAIPGSRDYPLNIPQTQSLLDQSSTAQERQLRQWISSGMESLKLLQVEQANHAFAKVSEAKEDAYVWQAGLAKFYMDDWEHAAQSFVHHGTLYETKYKQPASEERIWRDACVLNLYTKRSNKKQSFQSLQATLPHMEESEEEELRETRKVLRMARELFTASIQDNVSSIALARAKLRSVCGEYDADPVRRSTTTTTTTTDKKMWRLTAWFYLGLHYDVTGNYEESKHCMKMALRQCGSNNSDDSKYSLCPWLIITIS